MVSSNPRSVDISLIVVGVRGLYDYASQGPDELGIREGELIELSAGPKGGKDYGDGWWEGEMSPGSYR